MHPQERALISVWFFLSLQSDENKYFKRCGLLGDDKIKKVGICGMGGVGKTTLMKKIHNEYLAYGDFDLLIWFVMSKDVNDQKSEKLIFDRASSYPLTSDCYLEMKLRSYARVGRDIGYAKEWEYFLGEAQPHQLAILLYNILSTKRFVLLLDNLWQHVDITKFGIPEPIEASKSKVIFTTRSKEVSCRMNPDEEIELDCLDPTDSWKLFERLVGEKAINSHPSIRTLAHQVAKECGGLPLAILVVAGAMSCKYNVGSWEHA